MGKGGAMSQTPENPVTSEELAAALPHVLAAPRDSGQVRMLCVRPKPNERVFPEAITFQRTEGVVGDFEMSRPWLTLSNGSADPRIQVSLMSWRVLDLVWRDRHRIVHPGDNIVVDMNLTEENLPTGTLLSVGTAILKISDVPNDGCAKWKVRQGRAAYDWTTAPERASLRLRGLFCQIIEDGKVSIGDVIRPV